MLQGNSRVEDIGVGLIGTGYMGKCHALAWSSVRAVFGDCARPRLVHLAESTPEKAEARASEFGFDRATGDWRRLVEDPEVDVVSVTTPNQFHAEMAIAALEAGKHVWCEKPMAPTLPEAERMLAAARRSGRVTFMGYNYIQNPAFRHIVKLVRDGAIGRLTQVRIEVDEDFMADPEAPFYWKSEASSGHGALDDFAVHALSMLHLVAGRADRVVTDMSKPYADRPTGDGGRRAVETWDIASVLMRLETGVSATLQVNRSAWGRKGRICLQLYGSEGTILFDQERFNEFQLYRARDPKGEQGFVTVLTAPHHPPYDRFCPAPGHGLGFNELKVIECRQLLGRIAGETDCLGYSFEDGIEIERTIDLAARAFGADGWVARR